MMVLSRGSYNINTFQVTLFGQSAGAQSTLIHMMSNISTGLFNKAIIESAPSGLPYKTPDQAKIISGDVRMLLFCEDGDMACMRSRSLQSILDVQLALNLRPASTNLLELFENIGPVIDGQEVPVDVMPAAMSDRIRRYPTMIGTVTEECRPFVYEAIGFNLTKTEYIAILFATYPSHSLQMLEKYPPPEDATDSRDTLVQLLTDFLFTCPSRNISTNIEHHGQQSIFRYVFDHAYLSPDWSTLKCCYNHVCHGAEEAFVFYNLHNHTTDEDKLSLRMLSYWTNFAHTSDPNKGPNPNLTEWPTNDDQSVKYFKTPEDTVTHDYRSSFCDFWDSAGYDRITLYSKVKKLLD